MVPRIANGTNAARGPSPMSALEAIRSLERARRDLDKALTEVERTASPPPPRARKESDVRARVRCALVVAEDGPARKIIVDRLSAAGFHVEWATRLTDAAARRSPDIAVFDHDPADHPAGWDCVLAREPREATQLPMAVLRLRSSPGPLEDRCITFVQWRDVGAAVCEVARAVTTG
jgi:hypothetical protein